MKSGIVCAIAFIAIYVLDGIQAESNRESELHHLNPYQRLLRIRSFRNVLEREQLRRDRRDLDFPTVCTRLNQTFMMDCNYCTCGGPDGLTAMCTLMACPPKELQTLSRPKIVT